jgi:CRP/FNR family cyclic AMP-dependent transcriptional regulator
MTTTTTRRAAALADQPFLSSMSPAVLNDLALHAYPEEYAAGDVLFREGSEADRFFLLRDGRIRLDMEVPERGQVEVETLDADCTFGWSWLFEPHLWQETATALVRCRVLVIDAAILRSLMATDPVVGYELMRRFAGVLFDRLKSTRSRLDKGEVGVYAGGAEGPWAGRPSSFRNPR